MKQQIYFVTTNASKFKEISSCLAELDPSIVLEQVVLDLPEIQSYDRQEIAAAKAQDAWAQLQKPLIVDDAGMYLEKYPLFPGPLIKCVRPMIGMEGVLTLAGDNRNASLINCLVYIDSPDQHFVFEGVVKGRLMDLPHHDPDKKLQGTDIFVPEGYNLPFAHVKDLPEFKRVHYRYQAVKQFVDWFNAR